MDQSGGTDPIINLPTGRDSEASAVQPTAQPDEQQSLTSKLLDAQLSEDHHARPEGREEIAPSSDTNTRTVEEKTVQCLCGSSDDNGSVISCDKCRKRQHIACYYPDQENETLGEEFRHICIDCAPRTPFETTAESTDEEGEGEEDEGSVDEYTSGFSEASAAASQFGEASIDGSNMPDVFFYMTQDVQEAPASTTSVGGAGHNNTDDDTLRIPPVNEAVQEFREQFFALSQIPLKWEDPKRLDTALKVIPRDRIYEQAQKAEDEAVRQPTTRSPRLHDEAQATDSWGYNDFIIMALMQWFKHDFFTWETSPPCPVCSAATKPQGETAPTPQEREDSALVVELYTCGNPKCGASTRFPRYSDPWRLLETRRGRLAEWANCFGMLCRAVGARVRWVWNADKGHIWLEVYSTKKARWASVDILEVAWDKPLLYTEAWGQKMSYCIAFSADGATDVTRRYVRSAEFQLPRRRCSEAELEDIILEIRELRRAETLNDGQRALLEEADDAEEKELLGYATQGGLEKEEEARGRTAFKTTSSPLTNQTGFALDKGKGIAVS